MLEKEFVPYEQALILKELGFDEPYLGAYYHATKEFTVCDCKVHHAQGEHTVIAPTFSQAFKFFREKHNWQHSIEPTSDQQSGKLGYNYWIWNYKTGEEHYTMPKNRPSGDWEYEVYEQTELACLRKLIEIVKL